MQNDIPLVIEQLPARRRSLRVAVVTETYPPEVNGVALSLARFVEGLRERNHDIQLVRPRQTQADRPETLASYSEVLTRGVPIPRYPELKMGLPAKRLLIRQWTLDRPDVVHVVTEGPLGWSAMQAALKLKIPLCSDFRTNFHAYSGHYGIGWLKKPILGYLRKFHNRTQMTLVPTEQMRAQLTALGFRGVQVLSRGVDAQLFSPGKRSEALRSEWGATPGTLVCVYVGRLASEKNLDLLAKAFEHLVAKQPNAKLVLVGSGPEEDALRRRLPQAIFTGTLRGEALARHYASADLFVFPSLTETFGNVTVEAMASGLAVLAFDHAAASEHVVQGSAGALACAGQWDDFLLQSAHIAGLHARNPAVLRAMGAEGRKVAEALDWSALIERLETLLYTVACTPQSVPSGSFRSEIAPMAR